MSSETAGAKAATWPTIQEGTEVASRAALRHSIPLLRYKFELMEAMMKVKDIMTAQPTTCAPSTNLAAAAALMLDADCGICR